MSEGKSEPTDKAPEVLINPIVAAAHELKTPLTIIAHIAACLEDDLFAMSPGERRESIQRIRLSAERTLRLAQGLTVSQQLNDGQLGLGFALEPLNIAQLCEEAIDEMLPFARAQDQRFMLKKPTSPQLAVGNRELLRSVLFNLLDNAVKHNPPEQAIHIQLGGHRGMVRFAVQDNGPSLKSKDVQHLSQTIGRELQPIRGRAGNSGLGLYITGQMLKVMGGRLSVRSVSVGTSFFVD
ncbi:MAG TPA: HAMP domain-containing sensor histidine kinase, partial [Candidatus Acidoferrum sp.]|nr:HAMP domain-containing sensor histidine kinase [Candidatus Acidoferrum sp.]